MTEHVPERIWSNIDIPKTLAGVLAAVSAAVIGSFLGVAGTLAGAAIASVVGSIGTELYKRWIDRGSQKIKSTFVTAPAAVGTPPVQAAHSAASQLEAPGIYRASASVPAVVPPDSPTRQFRWGRAVAVAAAFFVLAVALLTVFELVTHRSIADAVGNGSGKSTTIGSVLTGHERRQNPPPAPTPSDSPSPTPTQSTDPQQGGQPTTDAPGTQTPTAPPTRGIDPTQGTEPTQGTDPTQGSTGQNGTGQSGSGQSGSGQGGTFQGGNNGQGGAGFRGDTAPTPDQE